MKLHFVYDMQIEYSVPVSRCNFTIKCMPKDTMRQRVISTSLKLLPRSGFSMGRDGLGNVQIYGVNERPHQSFQYRLEGDVITGLSDYEEQEEEDLSMIFRHAHGLVVAGEALNQYYAELSLKEETPLARAKELMHALHQKIQYLPCCTHVHTTAEEAFRLGGGVCQDYAQILIALLHLDGIAARYVTGFIVGEGASHAWVEVLSDGKWYGLDPTNDVRVGETYIKLGIGRDAGDCAINRGIMHGGGAHTQRIQVMVSELEG